MAGTIRYTLNMNVTGATDDEKTRNSFYWIANYLDNHPAYSRIASYYNGGTGWLDSGEKSFGVWRNNSSSYGKWDIFVDWSFNTQTNLASPFWTVGGGTNYGVGIGIAKHSSSVAWQGTTNNNGTDTFGVFLSHPWKSGSIIFPASNGKYGGSSANSNNMAAFRYATGTGTSRIHCIGDNDNLVFLYSENNDAVFDYGFYFLDYQPITSSYDYPYFMYCYNTALGGGNFFERNSALLDYQSVISLFATSSFNRNTVYTPILDYNATAILPSMPLNFETGKIYEYPFWLGTSNGPKEFVGYPTFVRAVSKRLGSRDRIGSATRLIVGNGFPSNNTVSASVPWDGSTNPGGGTSQTGTNDFVTSSVYGMFYSQSFSKIGTTTTITTTITSSVSSSTDLWRYLSGGSYFFSASYPTGQQDIVKVR